MISRFHIWMCIIATAAVPAVAQADRGALTLEVGGGLAADSVAAPFSTSDASLTGWTARLDLAVRYALRNSVEVFIEGYYEPPATYYYADTTVRASGGSYTGTLRNKVDREGVLGGVRLIGGMEWRPFVEVACGWSHRSYREVALFDTSQGAYIRDYGLGLQDVSSDNVELAGSLGLMWTPWHILHGKAAASVALRVERLLGTRAGLAFSLPIAVSWSWYL